jgi:hypothetical protein
VTGRDRRPWPRLSGGPQTVGAPRAGAHPGAQARPPGPRPHGAGAMPRPAGPGPPCSVLQADGPRGRRHAARDGPAAARPPHDRFPRGGLPGPDPLRLPCHGGADTAPPQPPAAPPGLRGLGPRQPTPVIPAGLWGPVAGTPPARWPGACAPAAARAPSPRPGPRPPAPRPGGGPPAPAAGPDERPPRRPRRPTAPARWPRPATRRGGRSPPGPPGPDYGRAPTAAWRPLCTTPVASRTRPPLGGLPRRDDRGPQGIAPRGGVPVGPVQQRWDASGGGRAAGFRSVPAGPALRLPEQAAPRRQDPWAGWREGDRRGPPPRHRRHGGRAACTADDGRLGRRRERSIRRFIAPWPGAVRRPCVRNHETRMRLV